MADEEDQQIVDQAILDGIQSRPSAGTAVAVRSDGARTEQDRYDYKAQMMNRQHEGQYESGGTDAFTISGRTEHFVEEDRNYGSGFTTSTSSANSRPGAFSVAGINQIQEQQQQQQQQQQPEQQPPGAAATSPNGASPAVETLGEENEDFLTREKDARQKKEEQAARTKKICLIGAIAVMVVIVVVIVVILVSGGDSGGSNNNNNSNNDNANGGGNNPNTTPQPTPAPTPAPTAPTTSAPSVALENLDIQVHFEALSFWYIQYGFHYTGCEEFAPPNLTVSTPSSLDFYIQLQEQSDHRTGDVTCDHDSRNKVTCYPQDSTVSVFSTILLFVAGSTSRAAPVERIRARLERTQGRNCSMADMSSSFAFGHMCFPEDIGTDPDELQYEAKLEVCYGERLDFPPQVNLPFSQVDRIQVCAVRNGCFTNCDEPHTTALSKDDSVDLPWCHLTRDDAATPPFQWNSQAMWHLVDEYLYIPDYANAVKNKF